MFSKARRIALSILFTAALMLAALPAAFAGTAASGSAAAYAVGRLNPYTGLLDGRLGTILWFVGTAVVVAAAVFAAYLGKKNTFQ